ncbi:hypothetical protein CFAEC_04105 [Corynebacterium faecale]|uniref:DUF2199 domain-containing protein n=1 Tax=Corynebacterium faecale TaxID=1758466 RepID=UPI0025B52E09|nr:DUF2199 domain-containing protein [Corynebacterium faecale]WJY91669.1 hypothetical protein CFAEC_04105 [Corynebacterium faecale]
MKPIHFYCPDCDHTHVGLPVISRPYPDVIATKINRVSTDRLRLGNDACRIMYPKPRRSFVRANLDIPITDEDDSLPYGLWVELSERDFDQYRRCEKHNIPLIIDGWLANEAPDFPGTLGIPVQIVTRAFPLRPLLQPVEHDNDLWRAFEYGIEDWEAQLRMEIATLASAEPEEQSRGHAA